ncbi:DUF262 domain-containing protein [Metabacillus fastidiosus]|uniref:DUF262 domain-containing protein n=1 Tax=Metabacillus fastidiosus TaxID=1458 RepID=UPI002E23975C|nr:DUF262 domain-containing protein [Metabacillus fastidiosus]
MKGDTSLIKQRTLRLFIKLLINYEKTNSIYNLFTNEGILLGNTPNIKDLEKFLDLIETEINNSSEDREDILINLINNFMERHIDDENFIKDPLFLEFLFFIENDGYKYSYDLNEENDIRNWSLWGKAYVDEDADDNDNDEEEVNDLTHIPENEREVSIQPIQHSIFELHRKYERGDLILQPFYQRKHVWKNPKKTKLVESVLRKIPIPSLYFAETTDGKWEVIDGQQRLRAFFDYLNGEYQLSQMPVLDFLKGKKFKSLDSIFQRKLEDYQLHVFLIKRDSHPDIRFDIFERINEGATPLNAQELRNSMYRYGEIAYLKKLASNKFFIRLTKGKIQASRLKDQEAVLRFLAFYINGYESYNGNLNSFLNHTLDKFANYQSRLDQIEEDFNKTMKLILDTLGSKAFIKDGSQVINMSLFDTITYSFNTYKNEPLDKSPGNLRNKLMNLINNNADFKKAISSNTLTKKSVYMRFDILLKEISKYLEESNHI